MSELFTYGSVRGAAGDGGPYRDTGNSRVINSFSFRCGAVQLALRKPTARSTSDRFQWRFDRRGCDDREAVERHGLERCP